MLLSPRLNTPLMSNVRAHMSIAKRLATLFGIAAMSIGVATPSEGRPVEQAVIIHFAYGSKDLQRLFALETRLEAAIAKAGVGQYDGNEVAVDGNDGYLYMYGPAPIGSSRL